jgi:hypothetical protein
VYSHTSNTNGHFLKETPLDIPEFKSPYIPQDPLG